MLPPTPISRQRVRSTVYMIISLVSAGQTSAGRDSVTPRGAYRSNMKLSLCSIEAAGRRARPASEPGRQLHVAGKRGRRGKLSCSTHIRFVLLEVMMLPLGPSNGTAAIAQLLYWGLGHASFILPALRRFILLPWCS